MLQLLLWFFPVDDDDEDVVDDDDGVAVRDDNAFSGKEWVFCWLDVDVEIAAEP